MNNDMQKIVEQYLVFWDQTDIDGLMSVYSPDIEYFDMTSGDQFDYADLKGFLTDLFARKKDQQLEIKKTVYLEGSSVFIYWGLNFIATDTARKIKMNGVKLLVFKNERISQVHEFYEFHEDGPTAHLMPIEDAYQEKIAKLGLSDEMMEHLVSELSHYLKDDKPYLVPELTLATVADHLGYTRNQISFVINHVLDKTFYDLVNGMRIDHVIEKMSSPDSRLSLLELGFDAGFNSVSGFYNAFKKHTDMTPAQFKRNLK